MKGNIEFYFKIDASAGLAVHMETGEPEPAYMKIVFEDADIPVSPEKYAQAEADLKKGIASQFSFGEELIYPITRDEYFANNEEDEA